MRGSSTEDARYNAKQIYHRASKVTCFLLLLFLQVSCGGGASGTSSASTATGVAKVTPDSGSAGILTSGSISVSFNTRMDASTVNADTLQVAGPEGTVSGIVSYDGSTTATFTPTAPLMPLTTYTATLSTGVRDLNGQPLSSSQTWTFITGKDALMRATPDVIPATFFGQHIHHAITSSAWPTVQFGAWRLWDADVTWPNLEPNKGEWHFDSTDQYVSLAAQHNVEIIMPLALSPGWASARPTELSAYSPGNAAEPANLEDWKNYVQAVATRYKGRIHYYEIWNEPNGKSFYSGSVPQMVNLVKAAYQIVKTVDPSAKIISPSAVLSDGVTWLDQFLAQGGGDSVDIIGFHLYVTPGTPEAMAPLAAQIKAVIAKNNVIGKPLWNTESGWYIQNSDNTVQGEGIFSKVLTDGEATAYIARSFVINWASGIDRSFWYAWDNNKMGMVQKDGKTLKASSAAFTQISNWLSQRTMVSCGKNSQGTWVVKMAKSNGHYAWIIWNPDSTMTMALPNEWNATQMRDLMGNVSDLTGKTQQTIGPTPILLEN